MNWGTAKAYCSDGTFNSSDDWRLPTKDELVSLSDSLAAIDQGWYNLNSIWSSTDGALPVGGGSNHYYVSLAQSNSNGTLTSALVSDSYDTNVKLATCVR